MGKFFDNLNLVLGVGLVIALALMMGFHAETISAEAVLRWLHVFFGITWIGLLYYFNFVQIPTMPAVPAELARLPLRPRFLVTPTLPAGTTAQLEVAGCQVAALDRTRRSAVA